MGDRIRIGIIGTGVGIRTHYAGFKNLQEFEMAGIVGSTFERSIEFASKYDFKYAFRNHEEMIDSGEIDLICVASPNNYHFEQIMYSLKRDMHILAEKPLALSTSQICDLIQNQTVPKRLNIVDHQLRFNPYIKKVKSVIDTGQIGRPYYLRIHQQSIGFSDINAKWSWSFDDSLGGGVRLAMASHLVDLLNYWFQGIRPILVKGAMDSVIENRNDNQGNSRRVTTSSFFSTSISFENQLDVQLSATAAAFGVPRFDFSIYGTKGELHFDLDNKLTGSFLSTRGSVSSIAVSGVTDEEATNKVSIFSGSFIYLATEIANYFRGTDSNVVNTASSFKDALYTQEILDAILQSSINGTLVKFSNNFRTNSNI